MNEFSLEEIWRQMNELKSKHSDLDATFKSVINIESPCKFVSSPKEDSMSGSRVLETSQHENQRSHSRQNSRSSVLRTSNSFSNIFSPISTIINIRARLDLEALH